MEEHRVTLAMDIVIEPNATKQQVIAHVAQVLGERLPADSIHDIFDDISVEGIDY
jgi:hypothetical protein